MAAGIIHEEAIPSEREEQNYRDAGDSLQGGGRGDSSASPGLGEP